MSKAAYVGVDGVARKIKKMYIGVDGVARKVKKAYVGVDGIAHMFYISQQAGSIEISPTSVSITGKSKTATATITYLGDGTVTATSSNTSIATVSVSGNTVTVTSVGAGSATITIAVATTDDYTGVECVLDVSVVFTMTYHGEVTSLSSGRTEIIGVSVGDKALFAGGMPTSTSGSEVSTVDAYSGTLTRSTPSAMTVVRSNTAAAVSMEKYALIAGGNKGANTYHNSVNAYSETLSRSAPSNLSVARTNLAGARAGTYAVIAGGRNANGVQSTVNAYSATLSRSTPTALSTARSWHSYYPGTAATAGNYAVIAGGKTDTGTGTSSNLLKTVEAYSDELTKSTATNLSLSTAGSTAISVGEYALIAGGRVYANSAYTYYKTVYAYNSLLTMSTPTKLSTARYNMCATTVGGCALFVGGYTSNLTGTVGTVDVYDELLTHKTISALPTIRSFASAATAGDYALVAGGFVSSARLTTVEAYVYG